MPNVPKHDETDDRVVRSDLAEPSRPGGHFGVHQPIHPSSPVNPPEEPLDDDALARQVQSVLRSDGRIAACPVAVSVSQRIIELDGVVEEEFQRTLAAALVNSVPGILNVVNLLQVKDR